MKRALFILSVLAFGIVYAEKMPFKRYQTIIDRQPFGQPPVGFNPEQMASDVSRTDASAEQELSQEQAAIQKSVSFSVINSDPDDGGVMVGFTDNADPKIPRHYYMRVGTTRDGWLVKEADILKKTMTVVKDGVEVTLELGSNSSGGEVAKAGAAAPRAAGSRAAAPSAPGRSGLLARRSGGGTVSSFQGRRRQRELAEAQEKADAEAREAERKRQAEADAARAEAEKAQREQERAEQREQLLAIQSELRRVREAKERDRAEAEAAGGEGDGVAVD